MEWFSCFAFWENVFLRSSRQEVFHKKGALRNFTNFTGKHCARVTFLIKLQAAGNFIHANFSKFLRTPFLTEHIRWLVELLYFLSSLLCYFAMKENVQTNIKGKTPRSSRSEMFFKIAVLKNLAITVKKTPVLEFLLIKLQAYRPAFY